MDEHGEPLPGATVLEKESGNGTITDMDGKFALAVSPDALIVVSYIGYADSDVRVNGKTDFVILLKEDTQMMSEVVVVGYGVQRKENLSGSVDQLTAAQLEQRPITDVARGDRKSVV